MKDYYVYIMTNQYNNVMYIGITNDLKEGFTNIRQGILKGLPRNTTYINWYMSKTVMK